ncbi:MAG TPA: hypothetical protein VIU45_08160 [Chitinophagaceae bacterium]
MLRQVAPKGMINLTELHKPAVLVTFITGIGAKGRELRESECKYNSTGRARLVLFMLKKLRYTKRFKILLRSNTP